MCLKQCAGMCFCLCVCLSEERAEGWYLLSLRLTVLVQWAWHWPTFTAITLALSSCPSHRHCVTLRLFSALERSTFTQIPNCLRIKWVHKICLICMWIHMCMSVYVPVGELGTLFCIEKKMLQHQKIPPVFSQHNVPAAYNSSKLYFVCCILTDSM